MAQYVFFMILSLGLYFASPAKSSSAQSKKGQKTYRILKHDGGMGTWDEGGK